MTRGHLVAATLGAVLATVLAGGVAWAAIGDGGVIQGCYDAGGNVKVVSALPCPKGFTQFSWNQQGIQGPQGIPGPKGDQGETGPQGPAGVDGRSFSGSFTSPNGEYSLSVTDAGITFAHGATNSIALVG